MPLISVVMTSYNHEKYLSGAIESVLKQTFADLELIIIDDASTDRSQEIIERHQQNDPRVRPIFHDKNLGISQTTNDGFAAAKGEYVAYIQSDDLWMPDKLEKQAAILQNNPELVVWSNAEIIDEDGNLTGQLFTEKYKAVHRPKSGKLFSSLVVSNYICGQSLILKTDITQKIQFDPMLVYANDYKFMIELSRQCEFYFIEEPLVQYRIHGDNSIQKNRHVWARDSHYIARYLLKNYVSELSKKILAKYYNRLGGYFLDRGHPRYAQKCFATAIKYNPRKTTYYRKFIISAIRSGLQ